MPDTSLSFDLEDVDAVDDWDDEEEEEYGLDEQLCDLGDFGEAVMTLAHYARQAAGDEEVDRMLAKCERWYRKTRQRLLDDFTS